VERRGDSSSQEKGRITSWKLERDLEKRRGKPWKSPHSEGGKVAHRPEEKAEPKVRSQDSKTDGAFFLQKGEGGQQEVWVQNLLEEEEELTNDILGRKKKT